MLMSFEQGLRSKGRRGLSDTAKIGARLSEIMTGIGPVAVRCPACAVIAMRATKRGLAATTCLWKGASWPSQVRTILGSPAFEYRFDLVLKAEPEDAVIEHADAKILVDLLSLVYLGGSEIDYVDDLLSASFKIKNPNATAACGCGTSFSV